MSRRFDEGLTFLGGAVEGAIRGWRDGQNDKMKRAELTAKMRAYEEDRKHKLIQDEIQARKAGFIIDRDGEGGVDLRPDPDFVDVNRMYKSMQMRNLQNQIEDRRSNFMLNKEKIIRDYRKEGYIVKGFDENTGQLIVEKSPELIAKEKADLGKTEAEIEVKKADAKLKGAKAKKEDAKAKGSRIRPTDVVDGFVWNGRVKIPKGDLKKLKQAASDEATLVQEITEVADMVKNASRFDLQNPWIVTGKQIHQPHLLV